MNRRRYEPVVFESYSDVDPELACPTCRAAPRVYCSRPDGRLRRVPCVRRPRVATFADRTGTNGGPGGLPDPPGRSDGPAGDVRDFGEPLHGGEG